MRKPIITFIAILLFIVCSLLLGCAHGRELDETAFALAVGIDETEDGKLEVSYHLTKLSSKSNESGEKQTSDQTDLITIKASTTAEARNLLNSIISPSANMSHAKILVVSEKLARHGLREVISPIVRFREYRGSMFIIVSRDPAKDFLKANSPKFTDNPAKYYEIMMKSATEANFFPKIQLYKFYLAMKDYSTQPYMAYAAISQGSSKESGDEPVNGSKEREYVAGSIPRSGGNKIEFAGTAVFRGDKMVGLFTTQETRALALLTGQSQLNFLSIEDPLNPQSSVMVHVGLMEKPKITAILQDGRPVIDVDISLEGEVLSIASGINYETEEYRTLLQQQVSNVYTEEINKIIRKTQSLNSDIVGFGYHLRSQFNTIDEFIDYGWNDKYQTANIRVHIKTILRRSGLMKKSAPIDVPEE